MLSKKFIALTLLLLLVSSVKLQAIPFYAKSGICQAGVGLVKDEAGNPVFFNNPPKRIVSGMPSITEMLFALGMGNRVVGVTTNCDYPPQAKRIDKVGREVMNIEKIVSLKPDVILMLQSAQKKDIAKLKKHHLPVFVIDPKSVGEVLQTLKTLGKITGTTLEAERVIHKMLTKLKKIKKNIGNAAPVKVTVIVGIRPLVLAGGGTFIDDVVNAAGGTNLAASAKVAWPRYSLEALIKENPEAIIIAKGVVKDKKEIYNDSRWQSLKAVRNDRLLLIDAGLISRPGPRIVDAVALIARFLHKL